MSNNYKPDRVGDDQTQAARQADLYSFLLKFHPDTVEADGRDRLRNKEHNSLVITKGKGFIHNATGEKNNAITYLRNYLGYSFQDAVRALCAFSYGQRFCAEEIHSGASKALQSAKKEAFVAPTKIDGRFSRTFAYLTNTRKIDAKIVQNLIDMGLLYETKFGDKYNAVFMSKHCDYAEVQGTLSYGAARFKGTAKNSDEDGYWLYIPNGSDSDIKKIYICESAIDAISLYQLQKMNNEETSFCGFLSNGGAKKDAAIERARKDFPNVEFVVATDHDEAGNNFAIRHKELKRIVPTYHDWNDTLQTHILIEETGLPY